MAAPLSRQARAEVSSLGSQLNFNAVFVPSDIDCITPLLIDVMGMENDPSSVQETPFNKVGKVVCRAFIFSSDCVGSNLCWAQQISTNCIVVTSCGRELQRESP